MKKIKSYIFVIVLSLLTVFSLTGCSSSITKSSILDNLNEARSARGYSTLVQDSQADALAGRLADLCIDYVFDNITERQFKNKSYDLMLTKINGKYFSGSYMETYIPTRPSDFSGEKVVYCNGSIAGVAVREYRGVTITYIIVY